MNGPEYLLSRARAVSSVEVAGMVGLALKRHGERYWACCPFHGEKTASMCFYPDGKWHCFGCNRSGDGIDLYRRMTGAGFIEAARVISRLDGSGRAVQTGVSKPRDEPADVKAWHGACAELRETERILEETESDCDALWDAVARREQALETIYLIEEKRRDNQWMR